MVGPLGSCGGASGQGNTKSVLWETGLWPQEELSWVSALLISEFCRWGQECCCFSDIGGGIQSIFLEFSLLKFTRQSMSAT